MNEKIELRSFQREQQKQMHEQEVELRFLVSTIFSSEGYNDYLWYEKAMLVMIIAKELDYNLFELDSVFSAIRNEHRGDVDVGEMIHILDQFARRLDTIDMKQNTVTEVALVCAVVGMKVASDESIWNHDLRAFYNKKLGSSGLNTITTKKMLALEREHLTHLDYVVGFGSTSQSEQRIQEIMKFVNLKTQHFIEAYLKKLKSIEPDLYVGSIIQKGIFKQVSDREMGFFTKCRKGSKTDDEIAVEKTLEVDSGRGRLQASV